MTGEPLAAPLADSVKVVAILEAAARSMHNDGRLEKVRRLIEEGFISGNPKTRDLIDHQQTITRLGLTMMR
ncbi:MAG: hypothetical protein JKP90_20330 [Desulfofustis sp. PB-SRB1]|nr:hypothetical protein [Desulfofustis sp. PB-SRB1]